MNKKKYSIRIRIWKNLILYITFKLVWCRKHKPAISLGTKISVPVLK